jgi:hypothetical protein
MESEILILALCKSYKNEHWLKSNIYSLFFYSISNDKVDINAPITYSIFSTNKIKNNFQD